MPIVLNDMAVLLEARAFPSITRWHRVEGIPRTHQFDRALRAEVRDALWMLTRQWQMGEFKGDDAGSPVFAKLHLAKTRLTTYRPRDLAEQPFDDRVPLEARVEQRPIPFTAAAQPLALDVRLLMGRHWTKLLVARALPEYLSDFRDAFPVLRPDPDDPDTAAVCAHRDAWQHQVAFAGRSMDGYLWYRWIVDHPAPRDLTTLPAPLSIDPGDAATINTMADAFVSWFDRLIDQPLTPEENAWEPSRLEYRFACSAPDAVGRKELTASEYYQGDLDWYALDFGASSQEAPVRPEVYQPVTTTFVPTAVEFNGMANTRWWSFEDRRVNFGGIRPDTTDLAKLLMMEFGLLYANDWCVVPVPLECGTVAEVLGLAITNVFGERLWVEPAGRAPEHTWQRWSAFTLSHTAATRRPDRALLMLPTAPKVQEGAPLEEVTLIRDEMANMVWGIELTVPLPHGEGRSGGSAAAETSRFYARVLGGPSPALPLENEAKVRYELMNTVPEHWIPFIPVHVPGDTRKIQLQRASMPRDVDGDPAHMMKIKPRTSLLREGLDLTVAQSYFVHEEEVPRAGVRVRQAYQRTRWTDGRVVLWFGATKKAGRGEGSSGLQFDRLVEIKKG
jgi:hypothetical protein